MNAQERQAKGNPGQKSSEVEKKGFDTG